MKAISLIAKPYQLYYAWKSRFVTIFLASPVLCGCKSILSVLFWIDAYFDKTLTKKELETIYIGEVVDQKSPITGMTAP